jgi:hypothetical protein
MRRTDQAHRGLPGALDKLRDFGHREDTLKAPHEVKRRNVTITSSALVEGDERESPNLTALAPFA